MIDGESASGDRSRPREAAGDRRAPGRGSIEITHRRRRAGAAVVVAAAALLAGILVGAGASGTALTRHPVTALGAYFTRLRTLAGHGPRSLSTSEQSAESAAVTRTLAYTPYVRIAGAQHREVALTFDDGPGPYTPQILRVLQRTHTPATFFEVGIEERYFHASTAQIVADGDPIGDHTETHAPMSELSRRDQQQQLLEQTAAIGDYGAPFPRLFRPPYGLWNATTLALLARYRMLMVMWTVDTSDYLMPGVIAIVRRAVDGARPGAIILMHDAGGNRAQTVAALPIIIRELRARGYRLVTVPRLLLDNPAPRHQNIAAVSGEG